MVYINHSRIQLHLLAEPDIHYKKTYELALTLEAADETAQDLQTKPSNIHLALGEGNTINKEIVKTCSHRCGGPHKALGHTYLQEIGVLLAWKSRPNC